MIFYCFSTKFGTNSVMKAVILLSFSSLKYGEYINILTKNIIVLHFETEFYYVFGKLNKYLCILFICRYEKIEKKH